MKQVRHGLNSYSLLCNYEFPVLINRTTSYKRDVFCSKDGIMSRLGWIYLSVCHLAYTLINLKFKTFWGLPKYLMECDFLERDFKLWILHPVWALKKLSSSHETEVFTPLIRINFWSWGILLWKTCSLMLVEGWTSGVPSTVIYQLIKSLLNQSPKTVLQSRPTIKWSIWRLTSFNLTEKLSVVIHHFY